MSTFVPRIHIRGRCKGRCHDTTVLRLKKRISWWCYEIQKMRQEAFIKNVFFLREIYLQQKYHREGETTAFIYFFLSFCSFSIYSLSIPICNEKHVTFCSRCKF